MELNGAELLGPEAEECDEGVELSLGLSIHGSGWRAAAATGGRGLQLSSDSGDADVDPADDMLGSVTLSLSSGGDTQQRREQHARRRQEARIKRQQRKGIYRGAAGFCSLEAQERRSRAEAAEKEGRWADCSPRLCGKHKKMGSEVHNQNQNPSPNPNPNRGPVRSMQYPYPQPDVQYVSVVKVFGVPCWAPAISVNSDGSIRPTASSSLSLDLNGGKAIAAVDSPGTGSSSSEITVHATGSFHGESSSNSEARSHARAEKPQSHVYSQVSNPQGNSTQATEEGAYDKLAQSTMATNKKIQGANSANKPISAVQESKSSSTLSLPRMPCVATTGDGPNGKTITGFLYGYARESEVSIVCVCHGSSFSPAEFVKHAGGTNISNPLRQIVVVPS